MSLKGQAWDYIIPILIRAFKNNMARRKDLCQNKRYWQDKGSSHDHVRDWEKNVNEWSKRIENMFETGNFTDMGVRPEQVRINQFHLFLSFYVFAF